MFRAPPGSLENKRWIDGIVYSVRQDALDFGSDRDPPVAWRPCLCHSRNEPFITVLPATKKNKRNRWDFFEIPKSEACFKREIESSTFVFYRYERIGYEALGKEIGLISHPLRLQIMAWIHNIYSEAGAGGK